MKHLLKPVGDNCFRYPRIENMLVDVELFISSELLHNLEDEALQQLINATMLPGVYRKVIGMPDIHSGYGLPIGGVMAMDGEKGLISAGAVGMDINCGVRLLQSSIPASSVSRKVLKTLIQEIVKEIPVGVGQKNDLGFTKQDFENITVDGLNYLYKKGMALKSDLEHTEEMGQLKKADCAQTSKTARDRGHQQLGTLGGGNHFIEIGYIDKVYDQNWVSYYGIKEGYLTVLIHTGSRAFGHQICSDFSKEMLRVAEELGINLPSKGLAAVPITSPCGQRYFSAMAAAVNYAFANRQIITHIIRGIFERYFSDKSNLNLVYDVAHNIARFEEHFGQKVLVHRKGATRALPAGDNANPPCYQLMGHPSIIPGSMGNPSYIMVGLSGIDETFKSINHGAGRILSRNAARKQISIAQLQKDLEEVVINTPKLSKLLDEAPQAYKEIDQVIAAIEGTRIAKRVARHWPLAVIKGED